MKDTQKACDYSNTYNINFDKRIKIRMADVNIVIWKCVEEIWGEYDKDRSGTLDREECQRFIMTTMSECMGPAAVQGFSVDDFNQAFDKFDLDGNGTIEKDEMVTFIRKVAGLSTGRPL